MSAIVITRIPKYTAADGTEFENRKAAVEHGVYLQRKAQLEQAAFDMSDFFVNEDAGSTRRVLQEDDLAEFLAKNGEALLEALTVKRSIGRRSKAAAPAEPVPETIMKITNAQPAVLSAPLVGGV